jgi:hypothetical protein
LHVHGCQLLGCQYIPGVPGSTAAYSPFTNILIEQEEDRRKLAEAGCAAVFEPASLYTSGEGLGCDAMQGC